MSKKTIFFLIATIHIKDGKFTRKAIDTGIDYLTAQQKIRDLDTEELDILDELNDIYYEMEEQIS